MMGADGVMAAPERVRLKSGDAGNAYRSVKRLFARRNCGPIGNLLAMLHDYKLDSPYRAFMPPLVGTTNEINALGDYLTTLVPPEKSTVAQPGQTPLANK